MRFVARTLLLAALGLTAVLTWWHYRVEQPNIAADVAPQYFDDYVEQPNRAVRVTPQNFDDYVYYYPTFRYAFSEARAGNFPFWNPYQHCGSPFFATGQHLLLYPLNVAFWWLPTGDAMKLTNQLHLALALAFTFLLARVVGLSSVAAVSAAVVYGFCPGMSLLIYLPHHLYGAVWIPLHLALVHSVMTRRRVWAWSVALSVALAAQYLGAYPMFCAFSAYAVCGYALWSAGTAWRGGAPARDVLRRLAAVGCAFLLAGAWAAPQLFPAIELAEQSPRSITALTIDQADPRSRGLDVGDLLLTTLLPLHDTIFFRPHPHVGTITLLLAALAALHRRHRRAAGFFCLLVLIAGLLSVGRNTPLFQLYFSLPTGGWFRIADRFFILVSLGLAVLAGVGTDCLWHAQQRLRRAHWTMLLGALLIAAIGLSMAWSSPPVAGSGTQAAAAFLLHRRLLLLAEYLVAALLWLVLYGVLSGTPRRLLVTTVPIALYVTLFSTFINASPLPDTHPEVHTMSPHAAAFLRRNQEFARTYIPPPGVVDAAARPPAKAGMLEHVYVVGDRENVFPRRIWDYTALIDRTRYEISQGEFHISSRSANLRLFDLMGVRFIAEGWRSSFLRPNPPHAFPIVYRDQRVRIYENPAAKPRAYLVYEAESVASGPLTLKRLVDPTLDFDTRVLLEAPGPASVQRLASGEGGGSARIDEYDTGQVTVAVNASAPAYLVLTDQYYPGWEAAVDGQPTPIYRANYLFRAVSVPQGMHRVVFRFVPRSFYLGALVAVVFAVATMAAMSWAYIQPMGRRR